MNVCKKIVLTLSWMMTVNVLAANTATQAMTIETSRPADFVNAQQMMPQLQTDIRYDSNHNFIGRKITGYEEPVCLLTQSAANALKTVEDKLLTMGLTLKTYDCYRPQMAVNEFAKWATQKNDTAMREEFYPTIDKANIFAEGYLAYHSGHTRGSTVDLTIVPVNSLIPAYNPQVALVSCTAPQQQRFPDNSLDFGTGYDCLSPIAHPDYQSVSTKAKANRLLLQTLMVQAGFRPSTTEWWHFTLVNEPYPSTYFNFPVKA